MIRRELLRSGRVVWGRLLLLVTTLGLSACGDGEGHPPLYTVNGQVMVKGKPLHGGVILFEQDGVPPPAPGEPKKEPLRATGKIGDDGKFAMYAFAGEEGIPEGKYKVSITGREGRKENSLFSKTAITPVKGNPDELKGRYADLETSGLQTEVYSDKPNAPVFDLK